MKLRDEDYKLIQWKLRMIPDDLKRDFLIKYTQVYFEELEKIDKNNYARHAVARHYANRFVKLYKVKR